MPVSQTGYDEIQTLSEKVKVCWETQPSTAVTGIPIQESVFKKEACLIKSIGESAYREIYEGRRIPTQNEHLWFEKCYGQVQKDSVNLLSNDEKIASETDSCLKRTLGGALFKKVKSGQTEVPYNLKKSVDICFGIDPQPFEQGTTYKIPETVKECLYNSVGEVRLNEIISGTTQASLEELEKTESCFAKLNEVQKKFLPPPPEQIPFLDENDSVLLIQAKQEKKTVKQEIYGGKLTLSGKATPNTIVSIYIYSDPIVVTTKTDENGDWVYEMQKPLEEGKHVAYALVKSEKSGFIRSSVLNFQVLAAEKEPTPQVFMEEEKGTEVQKKFIYYSIGAVLIVSLVVVAGIYYLQTKRKMKEIDGLTSQGDGKTKPGTGPVD